MEVIAGDPLQHLGPGGEDGHIVGDGCGQRFVALPIHERRDEFIPGGEGSFDNEVALGHEESLHVAARLFTSLAEHVVTQALEHLDPGIGRIVDDDGPRQARFGGVGLINHGGHATGVSFRP